MEPKKRERDSLNPKSARLMLRLTPAHLAALQLEAERRGESAASLARSILLEVVPPKEDVRSV